MILIIAEKPSQAKEYASALGGFQNKNGYFENKDYFITWCFGHLVELETHDKYTGEKNFLKDKLPILPEQYQYSVGKTNKKTDSGKQAQLKLIKELMNKSDQIINATDADREGELIFLYVYNYLNCKLPYKRLWISSLTENDIKKGFNNLLSSSQVTNLGKSGYARAIADWLVGVNGTQACTLQFGKGTLLTIGRVQTAILKIICERYIINKNFQKSFTYKILAFHNCGEYAFYSESEVFDKKEEADKILPGLNSEHICIDREEKIQKVMPPLLHSIDTLIIEANKRFGYSGQDTLNCAQSLYEKKMTSYPRTDSQYINEENYSNLKTYLSKIAKDILDIQFLFQVDIPKSVNDKKLTGSHDAIVPTGEVGIYSKLNEKEKNIYHLIIHKCLESFSIPAEYKKLKLVFDNNQTPFYTYASKLIKSGWKDYSYTKLEEEDFDEQSLDLPYKKDDKVQVENKEIKEIPSKPKPLYTEANLTPDLTNIAKFLKEENPDLYENLKDKIDLKDIQIGTQATRPSIIERLKNLSLIEVDKKKFVPTEKGLSYYNTIKDLEVSNIANTAILEKQLKDISEGLISENEFYFNINEYTAKIVNDIFSLDASINIIGDKKDLGKCPKCKQGNIIEGKVGYGCDQYKSGCSFIIWKEISGKKLSEKNIDDLINKGKTSLIRDFVSQKNPDNKFNAILKFDNDYKLVFDFETEENKLICPKCKQGSLKNGNKNYYCSNYKSGCDLSISKNILDKNISENIIKQLIEKGYTSKLKGFKGKNGDFEAVLKFDNNFKVIFDFD